MDKDAAFPAAAVSIIVIAKEVSDGCSSFGRVRCKRCLLKVLAAAAAAAETWMQMRMNLGQMQM